MILTPICCAKNKNSNKKRKTSKVRVSASPLSLSADIHYTPKILLHLVAEYCNLGNSEREMYLYKNTISLIRDMKWSCHTCGFVCGTRQEEPMNKGKEERE